ncbi:hypothetical protein CKAN_02389400 [Cinnamomum micranthum f. kanehirae]|uniref:Uncharacterized protein n=1 Tax=Cinnamomum micranthum f. kanehirae TaxID=337451 RepID=A0A443PUZ4_9MAGN|nr:hypothetical protein CKAN_02389400 [Cinnamomum micranthum f. kanehirae]
MEIARRRAKKKKSSSSSSSSCSFNKAEMKRRKRVAKYKMYGVERRVKDSFKKGIRWIKKRCAAIGHELIARERESFELRGSSWEEKCEFGYYICSVTYL